jgi:A/G-specific adenine glycosylase
VAEWRVPSPRQREKLLLAFAPRELAGFRRALLGWFARHKRDLPWRRTRDPYRIWLSEVMLQQTRVAAVLPYYERFLRRFPTVEALAHARGEQVLRLWAGLGYYSRARNLHRAAKEIVTRHNGRFPHTFEAALELPGIGRYTAAAILSIAHGRPHAVLDGNVARVLARLGAIRGDLRAPRRWGGLQETAQALLAPRAAGDWNQAMMELGATICTPRAPRCAECPAARWCRAYQLGIAGEIPAGRKKRAAVRLKLAAAVLLDPRGRTLLIRNANGADAALFSRMWQFPAIEIARNPRKELTRHLEAELGVRVNSMTPASTARHSVTYREIAFLPFVAHVERLPAIPGTRTPALAALQRLAVSNATRKIAAAALATVG